MNFSLNEEQLLLKDSISKYVTNDYSFEQRRKLSASGQGFSSAHWSTFAELGWLTVPFAQALGGFGGKLEDVAIVMEEFGRGLVLEPYMANVLLAGQLLTRGGSSAMLAEHLPAIMDGSLQIALAALERQSRQCYHEVGCQAKVQGDAYILTGAKSLVLNGADAQMLLVTARTAGRQSDSNGISLFLVDVTATGVSRIPIAMMDGSRVANIQLQNVALPLTALVGELNNAWALLQPVLQEAKIAACAEAVGIMDALYRKTVEYSRTRKQFGVAIGSFQALQHRMVDMFMLAEQSRSILYRAICEYQQADASAETTVAAMKGLIGKHGQQLGAEAIQIHGGMGMTDELDIGHYVKRLMVLNQLFGDSHTSLREFCAKSYAAV